jgi:hypothetical protein
MSEEQETEQEGLDSLMDKLRSFFEGNQLDNTIMSGAYEGKIYMVSSIENAPRCIVSLAMHYEDVEGILVVLPMAAVSMISLLDMNKGLFRALTGYLAALDVPTQEDIKRDLHDLVNRMCRE